MADSDWTWVTIWFFRSAESELEPDPEKDIFERGLGGLVSLFLKGVVEKGGCKREQRNWQSYPYVEVEVVCSRFFYSAGRCFSPPSGLRIGAS